MLGLSTKRARAVVLAGAAAIVLAVPAAPAGGAAVVAGHLNPNARLTTDQSILRGHDMPALAVDPTDPSHIVLMEENFLAGQCDFHASFDGGRTWSSGVFTVPSDFATPPCNTFDSGGYAHYNQSVVFGSGQNVYATFASHRGPQERPEIKVVQGEGDSIVVAHSTDGGRSFQTGVVAVHGSPQSQPYNIRPGIAVQPRATGDRVYVVGWNVFVTSGGAQGGGGDRHLVTAASDDGGVTWSAPVNAEAPGEHVREVAPPVVGPDGAVYTAYRNRDAPPKAPHPVEVAKSTDGGATWTQSIVAQMQPASDSANNSAGFPRLAIDPKSNTLHIVYQNFSAAGNVDLFVQHSTDKAVTWSAPVKVNDDPPSASVDHIAGRLAVAPNGRLDVTWLDGRNAYPTPASLMASPQGDIYYASSTDSGQTFSPNRRITDRSINLDTGLDQRVGSYIWYASALAPLGTDAVMFAWADSRLGNVDNDNQDIYYTTLQLTSSAPVVVQNLPEATRSNESIAASLLAYPAGAERIGGGATSKIVIVNQNDAASALAGAVLARANYGPLLLTSSSGLSKALREEVGRLRPSGAFVVGTTSSLPAAVEKDLGAAGVKSVTKISGATPEDVAAGVAKALDLRSPDETTKGAAAVPAAVVVNPASPDAAAAAGLAAALRYPILFVGPGGVPAATANVIRSLTIPKIFVVGGPASVSDATLGQFPGAKRLGGADAAATSLAVATEAMADGVPTNVVFVADPGRRSDAALAGSAAARAGGLLVLTPHADATQAQHQIDSLHLATPVDQIVVVHSKSAKSANTLLIVISVVLGVIGLILLLATATMRSRARVAAGAGAGTSS
ncbi:MAG: cell wall-binding repeat-containing protein [Actinomycetota bacterium]|nr:cell wall-binding repeat-containing protein [Actinomycetota bacterium]